MIASIIAAVAIGQQTGFQWDVKPMIFNEVRRRAWYRVPWISQMPPGFDHDTSEIVWVPEGFQKFPARQVVSVRLKDGNGNWILGVIAPHGGVGTPTQHLFDLTADGFINLRWSPEFRIATERRGRLDVMAVSDSLPQGSLADWMRLRFR